MDWTEKIDFPTLLLIEKKIMIFLTLLQVENIQEVISGCRYYKTGIVCNYIEM